MTNRRGLPIAVVGLVVTLACTGSAREEPATASSRDAAGVAPAVVIDGRFDDWTTAVETTFQAGSALRGVAVRDDPRAVYLALRFDGISNVQGRSSPLLLIFDADGDPGTGPSAFGLPGADLVVSFGRLREPGSVEEGVAAWRPRPEQPERVRPPPSALGPYDLGLGLEPQHAAVRIEVRLARGAGSFASSGFAARAVAIDGMGFELSRTPVFRHATVTAAADGETRVPAAALDRTPGTDFRVVVWNVAARLERDPGFARGILAALDPDVVLLDELSAGLDVAAAREALPARRGAWSAHTGSSGGRQRGLVAARGDVVPASAFDTVAYADANGGPFPDGLLPDVAVRGGVPVTGAWIETNGRRVLAASLDLVCCGNSAGSRQDRIRRMEAAAVARAAREALASAEGAGAAGAIIGGDFNLVGSADPLRLAGRALGPGGSDLVDVYALQLDGESTATWVGPETPFPPGQLDYLLYSPELLEPLRAFVFETRDLEDAALEAAGLSRTDSDRASDHRPIVVDFAWRR